MMPEENEGQRGFKVQDRRRFSETGEPKEERSELPVASEAPAADAGEQVSEKRGEYVEINFSTFVISLSTQALAHLGEIPNPIDRSVVRDLESARQMIDILAMLGEKTKGNLERAEETLLENVLYDLRMRYVEASRTRSP
jgi:hypothetical protein